MLRSASTNDHGRFPRSGLGDCARALLVAVAVLAIATGARGQEDEVVARARALAAEGRVGAAIALLREALDVAPGNRVILRGAASLAFEERRWFEGARFLEALVAADPADPLAWYDLAMLRHNQCRFDLAIPAFRHLEALEGSHPWLAARADHHYYHGESARRLERYADAIGRLEIAVARAPDRPEYRSALAQALADAGRAPAAVAAFERAVALDPSADNYYGLGVAHLACGELEKALAALREARRIRPGDARTLHRLGVVATRMQDFILAESYLVEARAAAPRNYEVLMALAQAQRLQGRNDEADETRAVAAPFKAEADAATERGREFARRIVTEPEDAAAHERYALDLLTQGHFDEAQVMFLRLLSINPGHELAILNLSSLLARNGDTRAALQELSKILERDPDHERAGVQAARVYVMAHDLATALARLKRVVARHPESVDAHELLATVLRGVGDAAGAQRHEAIAQRLRSGQGEKE